MKRIAIGIALLLTVAASVFGQANDLQALAVVKLNKSETITVKQLKTRAAFMEKQYETYGVKRTLTADERSQLLDSLIQEKLIAQAAAKEGLVVTDTQVNAAFLNTFSQQLGQQVTEAQLSEIIQKQFNKTLEAYIKENTSMSLAEYKAYLKSQLTAQQYVYTKKQNDLQSVAATDEEIRNAYSLNKSTFVWNDMVKLFLVVVPKGSDAVAAKTTATNIRNQYVKSASSENSIKNSEDNGKKYQAGNILVQKTAAQAQQLGWSFDNIIKLFGEKVGYVSELSDTSTDYQFYAVQKKYDAKMLSLSDLVQPETTVTVYDYIKNSLTTQKQTQYFASAAQELATGLDTPANVDRKKTGADLKALLNW